MYAWPWPPRGGGVRGFGSPKGWGGVGPFLLCSAAGESRNIEGGSEDSVRIVGWSGVFKEVVDAFLMLSGSANGLSVIVECGGEVLNLCFNVGVLAPEGGGVRSRSSRGRPSSFSLSGSTWCWPDPPPTLDRGRLLRSPAQIELAVRVTSRSEYLEGGPDSRAILLRSRSSISHLRRV